MAAAADSNQSSSSADGTGSSYCSHRAKSTVGSMDTVNMGTVDTVDTVNIVDTANTVNTVDTVDTVNNRSHSNPAGDSSNSMNCSRKDSYKTAVDSNSSAVVTSAERRRSCSYSCSTASLAALGLCP